MESKNENKDTNSCHVDSIDINKLDALLKLHCGSSLEHSTSIVLNYLYFSK